VRPEDVVVVRVDRRHHLLGLRDVGMDEPAVHVRRVVPLAHRVDRELPIAVDPRREAVTLGHEVERVRLELEDALPQELAQRQRVLRQVHEDEPGEDLTVHRRHAQRRHVEVEELLLVGDVRDAPVE
jgi:hypothetical protein